MSEAANPVLWCVNIQGPDDLVAVESYLDAVWRANAFNSWWAEYRTEKPLDERLDARMWAVPIEWPYDANGHADDLANPSEEYAWLAARASASAATAARQRARAEPTLPADRKE